MTHLLLNDPKNQNPIGISKVPAQGLQRLRRLTEPERGIALELRVEGHQGPQGTWESINLGRFLWPSSGYK